MKRYLALFVILALLVPLAVSADKDVTIASGVVLRFGSPAEYHWGPDADSSTADRSDDNMLAWDTYCIYTVGETEYQLAHGTATLNATEAAACAQAGSQAAIWDCIADRVLEQDTFKASLLAVRKTMIDYMLTVNSWMEE